MALGDSTLEEGGATDRLLQVFMDDIRAGFFS